MRREAVARASAPLCDADASGILAAQINGSRMLEENREFKVIALFWRLGISAMECVRDGFGDDGVSRLLNELPEPKTFVFPSNKQAEAFQKGVEAVVGWGEHEVVASGSEPSGPLQRYATVVRFGSRGPSRNVHKSFDTPEEALAYLRGVEEGSGWMEYELVNDKDAQLIEFA